MSFKYVREQSTGLLSHHNEETTDYESVKDGEKRVHVMRHGAEREIRLLIVVENFRLAFYIVFLTMAIVGLILTKLFVEGDYGKTLRDAFGVVGICVYFDFPPSTYVLPSIWSFALIFMYGYAIASVFRVWVAKEEGKVSYRALIVYIACFIYIVLSIIVFTTCLSVQPDPLKPYTIRIHTAPYTNLTIAVWVLAVIVTWFGETVAWTDVGLPKFYFIFNRVVVALQTISMIGKLIHHINCLGDLDGGLWWNPNKSENVTTLFKYVDYLFMITVVVWPLIQSGILSWKRHKTHCVYLSLQDNRVSGIDEDDL